jgi:hypothetical protein
MSLSLQTRTQKLLKSPLASHALAHCPFALAALAALFLLLLTITTLKKLPITAPPRRRRMTGMRMAQTRGGKRDWMGWESSTKGCFEC